jgi:predicted permease
MPFTSWIRNFWRNSFRRPQVENDLNDELRGYIEELTERKIRAGLDPQAARRAALLESGGIEQVREKVREQRAGFAFDLWLRDFRHAIRALRRSPGFTLVAVLTLALGIGANTAIFSAINSLLMNPVGVVDAGRIVALRVNYDKLGVKSSSVSPTDFADMRDSKEIFAAAAAASGASFTYNAADFPEQLQGLRVTWQWFAVFGARPIIGRLFSPEEDQPNANNVVILEYRTWQRLFGGDPSVIEKTIQLNQQPYKVVGVMGPDFRRANLNLWTPLKLPPAAYGPRNRFNESLEAVAHLQPRISFEQAQAFVRVLTERVLQDENQLGAANVGAYAKNNEWSMWALPYVESVAGDLKTPMFVLMGAVGFVLLIACSNIAGLKLARASSQARELAVRNALGASRWQLIRQTLTESIVLAVAGSVLGVAVAYGGIRGLMMLAPENLAGGLDIRLDPIVMAFTAVVTLAAGILFGLVPAVHLSRMEKRESLKEGGRSGTATRGQLRLRSLLVTMEIALALVLLVGAGLFLRSLKHLEEVDTGFEARGVMTGIVALPQAQYREPEKQIAFYRAAVERLANIPGVSRAAAGIPVPFLGDSGGAFNIEGVVLRPGDPVPHGSVRWVSPEYFSVLRIPLKRGRTFTDQDTVGGEPVVIIDENLAQTYWPNQDPIGKRLRQTIANAQWSTIVGVVGHVKHSELASDADKGAYYVPLYQRPLPTSAVLVKTTLEPTELTRAIREAVRFVDPAQPVFEMRTMEERVLASLGSRRFAVSLMTIFSGIALFMAALGLYGVISYSVTQRTHEIGIRMALGAERTEILALVVRQGIRMALTGVALGVLFAFVLARMLSSQLFQVSAFDPVTFGLMAVMLVMVALLASFIPARRATRVNPLEACRYE